MALGRIVARRRWAVIIVWSILIGTGILLAPHFENRLSGPPLQVSGSESQRAADIIAQNFAHPVAEQDLIVFRSDTLTVDDPAYQHVIENAVQAVAGQPLVTEVIGPFDPRATTQVSSDGHVAAALIGLHGTDRDRQRLAPELTQAAAAAAIPAVQVYVTGKSPLLNDLVDQEEADLARAEHLGLPAAMVVLLLTSGTLIAAGVPVLLAVIGMIVAFGALGAATRVMEFNLFVPNIATMLGLGVGIDYSLLIVTRFREELAHVESPSAAGAVTVATAGETTFFSGATVILSLMGLLLVDAPIFHELAVGAAVTVAVMILGALTLVPATLVVIGGRIERFALPIVGRYAASQSMEIGGFWRRWASVVTEKPVLSIVAAMIILLALTYPVTGLKLGLSTSTGELAQRSGAKGRKILEHDFNAGLFSPIQVVVENPNGPLNDADLDTVARLTANIDTMPQVAKVTSITDVMDHYAGNHQAATLGIAATIPRAAELIDQIVNIDRGRNVAVIVVVPHDPPDADGATNLVRRLRHTVVPTTIGDAPVKVAVGGLSAQIVDISDESSEKLPLVGGFVVALAFVILAIAFRSLILPLKAIVMNLLSFGAAYGLLVLVFQQGVGSGFLPFTPMGMTQVYLPLLTFAILFGLSMDYEVFLIGRMKEAMDQTGDNETAVLRGLAGTARVITSAAAIMIIVFAAFTLVRLREVQELGFSLAAAVFLDATLVRLVLVPALMKLLGHWNWWFPAALDRLLPRVDL